MGTDHFTRAHKSAVGRMLRSGDCAVDPCRIPYYSQITFPDGKAMAVDTGSAVKSRLAARKLGRTIAEKNAIVIDRFFETKYQAMKWAKSNPPFMMVKWQ
jgi:3D (Asp-Asp-Asp) domain-containing protein